MEFRYDENGEFVRNGKSHGNIDGEIAMYRDVYLAAEKDYFLELMKYPKIYNFVEYLENLGPTELAAIAIKMLHNHEMGNVLTLDEQKQMEKMNPEERDKFYDEKLSISEGKIALVLAAIGDKVKINELVRDYDDNKGKKINEKYLDLEPIPRNEKYLDPKPIPRNEKYLDPEPIPRNK